MIPDRIVIKDKSELERLIVGQNKRYWLTVKADDGTEVRGIFTEVTKRPRTIQGDLRSLLMELYEKHGDSAMFLTDKNLFPYATLVLRSDAEPKVVDGKGSLGIFDIDTMKRNIKKCVDKFIATVEDEKERESMSGLSLDFADTPEKFRIFLEYAGRLRKILMFHSINHNLKIYNSGMMALRNCAMSMTAEMLGMGDILASAKPVTLYIESESSEIPGVFMLPARGIVFTDSSLDSNYMRFSVTSFEDCRGVNRKVADLQLLDFLCANTDRHLNNISILLDERGKVTDIQGIDNDSTFGCNFDYENEKCIYSCIPENMGIIISETAERLESMDMDAYRAKLAEYGITEPEAEKTAERFEKMREIIREAREYYKDKPEGFIDAGHTRLVSAENIDDYSFTAHISMNSGKGLFGTLIEDGNVYIVDEIVYCHYKKICEDFFEVTDTGACNLRKGDYRDAERLYELENGFCGGFLCFAGDTKPDPDAEMFLQKMELSDYAEKVIAEIDKIADNACFGNEGLANEIKRQQALIEKIKSELKKHNDFLDKRLALITEVGKRDKEILDKKFSLYVASHENA